MAGDGETIGIGSPELTARVSPLGAELQSLTTRDGRQLQWDGDPAVWRGRAPILFPVIGLLEGGQYRLEGKAYDMPKHGFARHSTFEIAEAKVDKVTLRLAATQETRDIYPFDFELDIVFAIVARTLTLSAVISNRGAGMMPTSFGFHPALRWPLPFGAPRSDHRIQFAEEEKAPVRRIDPNGFLKPDPVATPVIGETLFLSDNLFVDDALIFDRLKSRSVRYGASVGPQLHIRFDDFPTLGIWTKPGAGFICIEPWHGFSDPVGFTGDICDKPGIFEIAPGTSRTMSMSITLEDNPSF